MRTAAFHTLGCKVNTYETEAMQQALLRAGYELRSFEEPADVYIINTCSVTNIADRKSRQMLHRAKSMNPDAVVVAAGCYAQAAAGKLKEDTAVDLIVGNHEKREIAALLERYFVSHDASRLCKTGGPGDCDFRADEKNQNTGNMDRAACVAVGDIAAVRAYDDISADTMSDHTRAFLKIQDGCNQFCSYCIIPYVRGRVRSRAFPELKEEVERFAAQGYRELVLTGIHLSSYGRDLERIQSAGEHAENLSDVICLLDRVEGIERIRVGSLEPQIVTEDFVRRLAGLRHFCPHFHLSMQSGSDAVLRRMNRHYSTAEFRRGVDTIRRVFPDAAITTDIIAGFPGETEEEFQETLAFTEEICFYETHIFPYSRREGTRAAEMPGQCTRAVKAARAEQLAALNRRHMREFRERRIGRWEEILVEEVAELNGRRYLLGNTREYVRIAAPLHENETAPVNALISGQVTGFLTEELLELQR